MVRGSVRALCATQSSALVVVALSSLLFLSLRSWRCPGVVVGVQGAVQESTDSLAYEEIPLGRDPSGCDVAALAHDGLGVSVPISVYWVLHRNFEWLNAYWSVL